MLNPNSRSLYTSALTPPPGLRFDEAIATTYSMDPALLLEAPLYLALMATDKQSDLDPLSVLEAIRRYAKRITVYLQRGRILVPPEAKPTPLFGLLEEMIVEVTASGGGVFHPKVWAIRFASPDQSHVLYRLVVLTRNITTDRSWDLALQLEGTVERKRQPVNKALADFISQLPILATATAPVDPQRIEQSRRIAEELQRVDWELPDGFDELAFYLPGTQKFEWEPPKAERMAIISPFCADYALQTLVKHTRVADALIGRPEELAALQPATRGLFQRCCYLDDAAEIADGEETDANQQPLATGLHAKAYLFETRHYVDYTHVVMGSANATNAALIAAKNCEILVELVGKKRNVGGIDELLGANGLGDYLLDFNPSQSPEIDHDRKAAEALLEQAQTQIAAAVLAINCQPDDAEDQWALWLTGHLPVLASVTQVSAWPITVGSDRAEAIIPNATADATLLGRYASASVTGLIAFELQSTHPEVTACFVLNLPVTGLPEQRQAAILQTVINNQGEFLRYLLLMLGEGAIAGLDASRTTGLSKWLAQWSDGEDIPLLEELTRAYSRDPARLNEIAGLVRDLGQQGASDVIPEAFLNLWRVFASALEERHD